MQLKYITGALLCTASLALVGCSTTSSNQSGQSQTSSTTDSQAITTQGISSDDLNGANLSPQTRQLLQQKTTHFAFDSTKISAADKKILDAHAQFLTSNVGRNRHIIIEGYTDERGSAEYNLALGEHRAKAVQYYLEAQGVPASNIEVVSYGAGNPVDPASNEAAWAKNRRAVIDLLPANS